MWRNGRRVRLKIEYSQGCGGSSPLSGTNEKAPQRCFFICAGEASCLRMMREDEKATAMSKGQARRDREHFGFYERGDIKDLVIRDWVLHYEKTKTHRYLRTNSYR